MPLLLKILFLLFFLWPGITLSRPLPTLLKKSYRIQWDSRYFRSTSIVDSQGVEQVFPSGQNFTRWDNDIGFAYGLNDRLESAIGARYRLNNSAGTLLSSQGIESIWFQIKYRIPFSPRLHLTADTRFRQTVYSENSTNNDIVLGDPGNESEWGAHLTWLSGKKTSWSFYLGYRQPPNQLSEEIHYLLEFLWQQKKGGLSLGVDGIFSLQTDPYLTESVRPKVPTGGTKLYNSFNREWVKPYATLHYSLTPHWKISLGASQAIRVLSGDKGTEIFLSLSRTSKGITSTQKKITAFKEYSIEANVIKVSKKQHFVQIDQGLTADISKGMKFDIYKVGLMSDNTLLASGVAWEVGVNKSVIRIFKRYTDKKIEKGSVARGH